MVPEPFPLQMYLVINKSARIFLMINRILAEFRSGKRDFDAKARLVRDCFPFCEVIPAQEISQSLQRANLSLMPCALQTTSMTAMKFDLMNRCCAFRSNNGTLPVTSG